MKKQIQYIFSVGLIVFYIFVLSLSFFNRASDDYKLALVEHTLLDYPDIGLEYTLNDIVKYNSNEYIYENLGKGWSHNEEHFVWGKSDKMYLYYAIDKNDLNNDLFFFIKAGAFIPQDVTIYVNGNYIDKLALTEATDSYVVEIPYSVIISGQAYKEDYYIQEICLESDKGISPYDLGTGSDTRKLTVCLYETMISDSSDITVFKNE